MAAKKKKIKSAGRFGSGYGTRARKKLNEIESHQRKKQICPHCDREGVKRQAVGIWNCTKCGKKFAGSAYVVSRAK